MNELDKIVSRINELIEDFEFVQSLEMGTMNAFKSLEVLTSTDSIYSFGLYTSGEYNYLTITAITEEGLQKAAINYSKLDAYKSYSLSELEIDLKWSPCDSEYHDSIDLIEFEKADSVLEELRKCSYNIIELFDDFDNAINVIDQKITQRLNQLFIDTLKRVKDHFQPITDTIVFSVWMGDQSDEEREAFVSKINSTQLTEQYVHESQISLRN